MYIPSTKLPTSYLNQISSTCLLIFPPAFFATIHSLTNAFRPGKPPHCCQVNQAAETVSVPFPQQEGDTALYFLQLNLNQGVEV